MDIYKISIIIPIYNVEKYIGECLQSVASQIMRKGVECILVDDCGIDGSVQIATDFINNYRGDICFKLLHHRKNMGLSEARNTGLKAAKGRYIYFLDSDDTITPNCINLMYSYVDKYRNVDLVQGWFYSREECKSKLSPFSFPEYTRDQELIKNFLLTFDGDIVKAQNKMVKRQLLLDNHLFFKEGIIHEDTLWTFFLAKYIRSMVYCSLPTYFYRPNPQSITGKINLTKEAEAFMILISEMCSNIDSFMRGRQMEYVLDTLAVCSDNHYYKSNRDIVFMEKTFLAHNRTIEKLLFCIYKRSQKAWLKSKIHNLLVRTYKSVDL